MADVVESGPAKAEVDALNRAAQLPSIPKAALQTICSVNGLSRSGNKADLQRRIIGRKYPRPPALHVLRIRPAALLPPLRRNETFPDMGTSWVENVLTLPKQSLTSAHGEMTSPDLSRFARVSILMRPSKLATPPRSLRRPHIKPQPTPPRV